MFDTEKFLKLQAAGCTAREIATELGVTTRTIVRARASHGLSASTNSGRRVTAERLEAARRLLEDGCSRNQVAVTLRMDWATIARHFPESPVWSPQEAGRYARMVRDLNNLRGVA